VNHSVSPDFVAVKKSDDWSSVGNLYEDEAKQWFLDNPGPTGKDTWQTRLPNHDPSMDDPIWGPSVAMRVQGDYPAGSPVRQSTANLGYEDLSVAYPDQTPNIPKNIPADDDPTWDPDVESEWERDPESGSRYMYDSTGQKVFLDLKEGMKGSWLSRPTRKDANNLYTHSSDPRKLVFVREKALQGKQMKRDSDQNPKEKVAEMFLQHDKHLPKEGLVTVPLRGRSYQHAAIEAGLPDHVPNIPSRASGTQWDDLAAEDYESGVIPQLSSDSPWWKPSRWSDTLLPWKKPEKEKKDWHKIKQGKPMYIAYQLLKTPVMPGTAGFPEDDPNQPDLSEHPGDKGEVEAAREGDRTAFPTIMEHRDATLGAGLKVIPNRPLSEPPQGTFRDTPFNVGTGFTAGEPMDIAYQLLKKMPSRNLLTGISSLKPSFEYQGNFVGRPMGLVSYDSSQGIGRRSLPFYQRTGLGGSESGAKAGQWAPFHGIDVEGQHHGPQNKDWFVKPNTGLGDRYDESAGIRYGHSRLQGLGQWLDANSPEFEEQHIDNGRTANQWMIDRNAEFMDPSALGHASPTPEKTTGRAEGFKMGEPMDIAYQLLKDRKSPEAWAHKRLYDSQYEKNPKRVKYREQLNAERRRRGIYGKGGADVTHTQRGKLTLEGVHSNRARHFKGKGTLRRVKVR